MDLYVKSTDRDVNVRSVLQFVIQGGGSNGLQGVTGRGIFKTITILTQTGAVRIQPDKVSAIVK